MLADMWTVRFRDALRSRVAGVEAVAVLTAAGALFRAGGHRVLPAGAREVVQEVTGQAAQRFVAAAPKMMLAGTAAAPASAAATGLGASAAPALARAATSMAPEGALLARGALAKTVARAAGREVAKGVGRAAAVGLVLDGVIGGAEAIVAYRRGRITRREAYVHTATEALTGAAATGAGVALAAGAVAVTGGLGAPVVFAVAAAGAIGTKRLLVRAFPPKLG